MRQTRLDVEEARDFLCQPKKDNNGNPSGLTRECRTAWVDLLIKSLNEKPFICDWPGAGRHRIPK